MLETEIEGKPPAMSLWQVESGHFKLTGREQDWPCKMYSNWAECSVKVFVRIGSNHTNPDDFMRLPNCASNIAMLPICMRCSNQFNCLAGNIQSATSRTLALP